MAKALCKARIYRSRTLSKEGSSIPPQTQQATLPWNSFDARLIMHERQASFAQRGRKFMNLRAVGAASN
jgi:hypothetical protein